MPDAFSRERMLLGEAAVQRLRESHVIVFGLGGVGSFAVEALARAGDHKPVGPAGKAPRLHACGHWNAGYLLV